MRIYVTHAGSFNFKEELYQPLRGSELNNTHKIILPHEKSEGAYPSKELLKSSCDLVVAEISNKSTSMGVELGWANAYGVPIICIYKTGLEPSESLKEVTDNFMEYSNSKELISKLEKIIRSL
ncbi:MAG: hypothetical protein Q8P99_03025 [bacterium]|nr:hypothetical protein [bacterium]